MALACVFAVIIALGALTSPVLTQVLTPPYFNLAEGRRITASATCGVDVPEPELFCKLVGANSDKSSHFNVIQGQLCDHCDINDPQRSHPPQNAIDGSERWWQSPPLSRGMVYNQVNLTIDLGQLFQVAYVIIKMGNSPRPGVWVLERSVDNGKTFSAWQHFADNEQDCRQFFGNDTVHPIIEDDDVICTSQFSKVVPLEGGEIVVSLLNERPSAEDFFNSTVLQEFTRATNVRLKLIRTKTLLGHLMSVAQQDPTVTRRYFYSIKDISIGGRCVCNGHASVCDIRDPRDQYKLKCRCEHNTCGSQCEQCCPGFIQKKWRPSSIGHSFNCEPCNCFGHSNECIYDEKIDVERKSLDIYLNYEGGGVCQNCFDNTEGINCDECVNSFFRPYGKNLSDVDVCRPCTCYGQFFTGDCRDGDGLCECKLQYLPPSCDSCNDGYYDYPNCYPCDCHREGTVGGICQVGGGQCPCKDNYSGLNCDQCAPGYYSFPDCIPCECVNQGSLDAFCDQTSGQCNCENNYGGEKCERCAHGHYDFGSGCQYCNCDVRGTTDDICNKSTGECLCTEGYGSNRCDTNAPGFWSYPLARTCGCHVKGSPSTVCDVTGQCPCKTGYSGRTCEKCSPGFFKFPNCEPCDCDASGSIGVSCDADGNCRCKYNFDSIHCDQCKDEFYNFPLCEECNCDPAGVLETFSGCGAAPVGELCECKERVTGRICNKCRSLYWNLQYENPVGCEDCNCHLPGTIGALATCDWMSGQCICKPKVNSRSCDECDDGTFSLMEDNLFGCSDCNCNIGGSEHNLCNKVSGQCQCRQRIQGQRCDQPMQAHYFPTLYQLKYEAEDGYTEQNTPLRFGYDSRIFNNFSGRGYAVFSDLQKKTVYDIRIFNPTIYRVILFYRNPASNTVKGKIVVTPENPQDVQQEIQVHFPPTTKPELLTAATDDGIPVSLVLNPSAWQLNIETDGDLYLDYFVLLPLAYYEATILTEAVTRQCQIQSSDEPCLHYAYPSDDNFETIFGSSGFVDANEFRNTVEIFNNNDVLKKLETEEMAWLNDGQPEIKFDFRLLKTGPHVILLNYFTPYGSKATNFVITVTTSPDDQKGRALLYDCTYSWTCRQVVTNLRGEVAHFDFDTNYVNIAVKRQDGSGENIALRSIVMVPVEEWNIGMVVPSPVCTKMGDDCIQPLFPTPPDSAKIEFENNLEGKVADVWPARVDNNTLLVALTDKDRMVDIAGKLRTSGKYIFIVHYYQPSVPETTVYALVKNGKFFEGELLLKHCPSTAGCRSVISQLDGSIVFDVLQNFELSLKAEGKTVWLDYVLIVPEEHFQLSQMHELPKDNTADFFERCGANNFYIDPSQTGYCRDAAFAITTHYNNGALPCTCNYEGSISFECEVFGGQCKCRANVIGRECDRCATGYFGFPNCQPCDCPSTALCDAVTGDCICSPRVVGDKCEMCAANTYGYDPLIGCEECRCDPNGVIQRNLQCDLSTGQCQCKHKVIGRRCDKCEAGFWAFPFCQLCSCDLRGTEDDICSQSDASCSCKQLTEGPACELCTRGTYHLEESNPDGCTKCFCFGKAQTCSSSAMFWSEIVGNEGWKSAVIKFESGQMMTSEYDDKVITLLDEVYIDLVNASSIKYQDSLIYFSAPPSFLRNKLKSYGGLLEFTMQANVDEDERKLGRDVLLHGNNLTAVYIFFEDQLVNRQAQKIQIRLTERSFQNINGEPMKRDQFMTILHNLEGFYIKSRYAASPDITKLSKIRLQEAINEYKPNRDAAQSVEQCQCPRGYKGTSCEDCDFGYFRADTGPYGGFCIPCECNNHASTCDPDTGICANCRDNTQGDHCELCGVGHFGTATDGTPHDCLMCSCPTPSITNNFALSCQEGLTDEEFLCNCRPGYIGRKCERCAPGHYGRPDKIGDYCKSCECNDNIIPTSPYACDDISGLCRQCLNNTYGAHCEYCATGFFGDAITLKNCKECSCDSCGTRLCDHQSGVCQCQRNVLGNNCDQCAVDHWGLSSCQGCIPCLCSEASETTQCDLESGQCQCRFGVTGRHCEDCKPGFWDYSEFGCSECSCKEGFSIGVGCNPQTGQCSCLPGVIGDNCESCPFRWVLIEGMGCKECDDCVHALLDTTSELQSMLHPVVEEYASAKKSFFLHQRLQLVNDSKTELMPLVQYLDMSLDDFEPLHNSIERLEENSLSNSHQASLAHYRAKGASDEGKALKTEAEVVFDDVIVGSNMTRIVVAQINLLATGFETGRGARIELAIREADHILKMMNESEFDTRKMKVEEDYEIAEEYFDRMKNVSFPVHNNIEKLEGISHKLLKLDDMMKEMQDLISNSQARTFDTRGANQQSRSVGLRDLISKFEDIEVIGEETRNLIQNTRKFANTAKQDLENAIDNYNVIENDFASLMDANNNLNESVYEVETKLPNIKSVSAQAMLHATELKRRANRLDSMFTDTREAAENALVAANAYDNIVAAIKQAPVTAAAAENVTSQTLALLHTGLKEEALKMVTNSEDIHSKAQSTVKQVHGSLQPQLNESEKAVAIIKPMNEFVDSNIFHINEQLRGLRGDSVREEATSLQEEARKIEDEATKVSDLVDKRYNQLDQYAEDARNLSNNLDDADRDKKLAIDQVKSVKEKIPEMKNRTRLLQMQSAFLQNRFQNMGDRLEKLRRTITKTREQANKIKVGMDFKAGSLVELKNLGDLSDTATNTEISLYINTKEQLGLPLFLGTPVGGHKHMHRTSTDDFMAVEIDGGHVRLTTDLGAGAQSLTNSKYVADGRWHKISIKRVGKVVRLSVHDEDKDGMEDVETSEKVLPGTFSILNLDSKISKLYLGGIPPGEQVDGFIRASDFNGKVEDLWINKKPIGLWNFIRRDPADATLYGAIERDILNEVTLSGLRFDGTGYALLETKNLDISGRFSMQLTFKTLSEDGLLFILENGEREFVTLELRSGKILYQQNFGTLGSGLTSRTYNDDIMHTIEVTKDDNQFVLRIIDSGEEKQGSHVGRYDFTETPRFMYFGGFPGSHNFDGVTNDDFLGCVRKVEISEKTIDFLKSTESIGTSPGCPDEVVNLVSFHHEDPGFVKLPSPEGEGLQLVLKFRTEFPGGLLFYTETADKSVYLSLSLVDGALVLRSTPGGELTTGTFTQYNDSAWHFVIVTIENNEFRLDIDDFEAYSVVLIQDSVFFDGPVFFGGLENSFATSGHFTGSDRHFFGCIGDVTLNGRIVDFSIARKDDRRGAMLASCSMADHQGAVDFISGEDLEVGVTVTTLTRAPPVEKHTSTERTFTSASTNPPLSQCALPVTPAEDLSIKPENGARYGQKRDSRIEYGQLPHSLQGDFQFSLNFKTISEEGIILYASNVNHRQYVTIYLKDGKIVFSYNANAGATVLRSKGGHNNDEWHTLLVARQGNSGKMEVDGHIETIVEGTDETRAIEHHPPYYFGGVNSSVNHLVRENTENTDLSFDGCMRDFRMNSQLFGGSRKVSGVERCSYKVERGTFLGQGPRSYVVIRPRFNVGTMFSLSVDIKPRKNSGVIMSVHGKRDFVLLQLREGTMEFKIDNGKSTVINKYSPPDPFYFCDGNWHTIKVVKNRNVAILLVDDVSATPTSGPLGQNSADTSNPLFIGTQPRLARRRGEAVTDKYVGCIKNVILKGEKINLFDSFIVGNVNAGVCPLI